VPSERFVPCRGCSWQSPQPPLPRRALPVRKRACRSVGRLDTGPCERGPSVASSFQGPAGLTPRGRRRPAELRLFSGPLQIGLLRTGPRTAALSPSVGQPLSELEGSLPSRSRSQSCPPTEGSVALAICGALNQSAGWLVSWQPGCLAVCLAVCLAGWLPGLPAAHLASCLAG